ncbi:hypothetical protein EZS27_023616 [termite gut metagenome]|uniref:Uncharacterized protein n=1 Tax=termite gut metagenome TaxID=433724 RepID=A0A5J4R408_9ZZZZ
MKLISVIVRDRYFAENNINVNEVDNYDPNLTGEYKGVKYKLQ